MSPVGIVLFAHGARDPAWAQPFEAIAQAMRAQSHRQSPAVHIELAYLEFMSPNLAQATDTLLALACTRIVVVPVFLGAGGHVRRDLPAAMEDLQTRHPHVQWHLAPAIGEAPRVIAAIADAAWHSAQL